MTSSTARRFFALGLLWATAAACVLPSDTSLRRVDPATVERPDAKALSRLHQAADERDDVGELTEEAAFTRARRVAAELRADRERAELEAAARAEREALEARLAEAEALLIESGNSAAALARRAAEAEAVAARDAARDAAELAAANTSGGLVLSTSVVDDAGAAPRGRQPDPESPWTLQLTTAVVGDGEPEPAAAAPSGGLVLSTNVIGDDGDLAASADAIDAAAATPPPATAVLSATARRRDEPSAGQLVVGCDLANPPFAMLDERGIPTGRDVEMVERLAAGMGLDVLWYRLPFDELLPALEAGRIGAVCATMGITPERARRVAFTRPYFETEILAVVRAGPDAPRRLADLAGLRVSAGAGTTSEDALRARVPNAEIVLENDKGLAADERLMAGEIDAAVMDGPDAIDLVKLSRGRLALIDEALADESYAIALPMRDRKALVAWNKALQAFERSGGAEELDARHGLRAKR